MAYKRHWRDYKTATGLKPVKQFVAKLSQAERAAVAAGMTDVVAHGLKAGKHLRGDIYEVLVEGPNRSFRLLFSKEGRGGHVLLALHAYEKRSQKLPPRELALAEKRLADWRACGAKRQRA
jgi:phage-related protein